MDRDEDLLARLTRRNWLILAGLLLGSLPWRSWPISLGVLSGGLVSVAGYLWLQRSLRRVLAQGSRGSVGAYQISLVLRLGALAASMFVLIKFAKVNPIALAVGLSVVVINIFWTMLQRLY